MEPTDLIVLAEILKMVNAGISAASKLSGKSRAEIINLVLAEKAEKADLLEQAGESEESDG